MSKTKSSKSKSKKSSKSKLPTTIKLEVTPDDLAGFVSDLSHASELPTKRERREATLDAIGDFVDVATPLDAVLPPPLGTLVDDVLDIDGKLFDAVVGWAGKAWDSARDAYDNWRSKRNRRRVIRASNRHR